MRANESKYGAYKVKDFGFPALVGKSVRGLRINADKDVIALELADGATLYLAAVGGCCSRSWFEHLNGISALLDTPILRVVDKPMPEATEQAGEYGDEHTQYYGWTLETANGRCDLEMRNASNGYYGGEVIVSDVVSDQYHCEVDIPEMAPLAEDF